MSYELLKTLHLVAMVSWFAGLFYLPRLFVYHTQVGLDEPKANARYQKQERLLLNAIMTPAAVVTLACGFGLWYVVGYGREAGWLHAKTTLVFFLVVYHVYCWQFAQDFARGQNQKSERYFRVFNEVPTLILLGVVVLVVYRPF